MKIENPNDQDKTLRLLKYLRDLHKLGSVNRTNSGNQVLWAASLPENNKYVECNIWKEVWSEDEDDRPWIKLKKPPVINPAFPVFAESQAIEGKLDGASAETVTVFRAFTNFTEAPKIEDIFAFSAWDRICADLASLAEKDPTIPTAAFNQYVEFRLKPFLDDLKRLFEARQAYQAVYALHHDFGKQAEELELVLGIGLLTWVPDDKGPISRHLLALAAEITFNSKTGALVINTQNPARKPSVETDMLEPTDLGVDKIAEVEADLMVLGSTSRDIPALHNIIPIFANSIGGRGTGTYMGYIRGEYGEHPSSAPVVTFSPALVLRKRTSKAFQSFINTVINDFEGGQGATSPNFGKVCESNGWESGDRSERSEPAPSVLNQTIYFPLACNDEQMEIVHRAWNYPGVLTFGPPGTGKSHTIANLICHNLAEGKRILITSQSPRALQVLHGLLPQDIQPLCIQVLGQDSSEQIVLERCVARIVDKDTHWKDAAQARRITHLKEELHKQKSKLAELHNREREIREKEIAPHPVCNRYSGTMAEIAQALNRDAERFSWFTDETTSAECRITDTEKTSRAIELLQKHASERAHSQIELPPTIKKIDEAVQLLENCQKIAALRTTVESQQTKEIAVRLNQLKIDELRQLDKELTQACELIRQFQSQNVCVCSRPGIEIATGNMGVQWLQYYDSLAEKIESLETEAVSALSDNPVDTKIQDLNEQLKHIRILVKHVEAGGGLSLFSSKTEEVKEALKFLKKNRPALTKASLDDLKATAQRIAPIDTLSQCIALFELKIPDALTDANLQLKVYIQELRKVKECVNLCRLLSKLGSMLSSTCGLTVNWRQPEEVSTLQRAVRLKFAQVMGGELAHRVKELVNSFEGSVARYPTYLPVSDALNAIRDGNVEVLKKARVRLEHDSILFAKIRAAEVHVVGIGQAYPALHDAVTADIMNPVWPERIMQLSEACQWKATRLKVIEYLIAQKEGNLTKAINACEQRISDIISELASLLAWSACIKRMGDRERANLAEWVEAMKKARMKYSKFILRYRAEAQGKMESCRACVPAWIMPLHRVFETVSPRAGAFDLIIVDEASQCGHDALLLLLLGKQVIVVGDDQQISPVPVGLDMQQAFNLMDTYLKDFEHKTTFNPGMSLFDHCKVRFPKPVSLREHFRCMPEIIEFSNNLCYSANRLIPLRSYPTDRLEPLVPVFIENGFAEGRNETIQNRNEALAIVEQIKACIADRRYKDKTFGVIALQGQAQANLITKMLLEHINPAEIEKRRLVCGSPYSFQGDQRHIIFISMIVSLSGERRKPSALVQDMFKKRFNVAASRGQDQVFLFHSIRIEDLSPGCLRRMLLEHYYSRPTSGPVGGCENLNALTKMAARADRKVERPPGLFDSWFEVDVFLHLLSKGYRVIEQFPINEYRIDMVIEGQKNKLALECDGDYWHGPERWEADKRRQRMLERSGWKFFRLLESEYQWNAETAFEKLKLELDELDILPVQSWSKPAEREPEPQSPPEDTGQEEDGGDDPDSPSEPEASADPITRPNGNAPVQAKLRGSSSGSNASRPKEKESNGKKATNGGFETIVRQLVTDDDVVTIKRHIHRTLRQEGKGIPLDRLLETIWLAHPEIKDLAAKFAQAIVIMQERDLLSEEEPGIVSLKRSC